MSTALAPEPSVSPVPMPVASAVSGLPRVNLLPPSILEAERARQARLIGGGAIAVAAVVIVGATYLAGAGVDTAQQELDAAQSTQSQLQNDVTRYADVPRVYAAAQDAEGQLATAMAEEVRWSYVLNDLSLYVPRGVSLNTMTVTAGEQAVAAAVPGVATPGEVIGAITFNGTARSYDWVAAWLDTLAKQPMFTNPYLSSASAQEQATKNRPEVAFDSSVQITAVAKSHRYDNSADAKVGTP